VVVEEEEENVGLLLPPPPPPQRANVAPARALEEAAPVGGRAWPDLSNAIHDCRNMRGAMQPMIIAIWDGY